jgi:hypothetical protein
VVLVGVPTGLFADYYGNPPSRADRLRNSVLGRGEPRRDTRRDPRYSTPRSAGDEGPESFGSSGTVPGRLPNRGIAP